MIGLLYLVFFVLYLAVSVWVVMKAYHYARQRYQKGWAGGWLAALFMYHLVFWDLVPVFVMHQYYCSTEAGFWVYKTPERWLKENPSRAGQDWTDQSTWKRELLADETSRYWLSDRIYVDVVHLPNHTLAIIKKVKTMVDDETNSVIAKAVEFYRGNRGIGLGAGTLTDYKLWLGAGHRFCGPATTPDGFSDLFDLNRYELEQLIKGSKE